MKELSTEQILEYLETKVDQGRRLNQEDKEHILKGKIAEAEQEIQGCLQDMKSYTKFPEEIYKRKRRGNKVNVLLDISAANF